MMAANRNSIFCYFSIELEWQDRGMVSPENRYSGHTASNKCFASISPVFLKGTIWLLRPQKSRPKYFQPPYLPKPLQRHSREAWTRRLRAAKKLPQNPLTGHPFGTWRNYDESISHPVKPRRSDNDYRPLNTRSAKYNSWKISNSGNVKYNSRKIS